MMKGKTLHTFSIGSYSASKKWNTDTCYNVNETWKLYAKWKKANRKKNHVLHDAIYMKYTECVNPYRLKAD